jgi:hypothetical protein
MGFRPAPAMTTLMNAGHDGQGGARNPFGKPLCARMACTNGRRG